MNQIVFRVIFTLVVCILVGRPVFAVQENGPDKGINCGLMSEEADDLEVYPPQSVWTRILRHKKIIAAVTAAAVTATAVGLIIKFAATKSTPSPNPTELPPTTSEPSTQAPTVAVPTTGIPSTAVPSTGIPTTASPSTLAPSTLTPTTLVPSTTFATTAVPSTGAPSILIPSTLIPTTGVPTTARPSTAAPSTLIPSTLAPTTPVPTPSSPSDWVMWNATTGVYADGASESTRFTTFNGVVTDSDTGLQWEATGSSGTYTWDVSGGVGSAQAYCASQTTGDFSDWRLPTVAELITLVDYTVSPPMIDQSVFPNTQQNPYWTSVADAQFSSNAWVILFGVGFFDYNGISVAGYARCVR